MVLILAHFGWRRVVGEDAVEEGIVEEDAVEEEAGYSLAPWALEEELAVGPDAEIFRPLEALLLLLEALGLDRSCRCRSWAVNFVCFHMAEVPPRLPSMAAMELPLSLCVQQPINNLLSVYSLIRPTWRPIFLSCRCRRHWLICRRRRRCR